MESKKIREVHPYLTFSDLFEDLTGYLGGETEGVVDASETIEQVLARIDGGELDQICSFGEIPRKNGGENQNFQAHAHNQPKDEKNVCHFCGKVAGWQRIEGLQGPRPDEGQHQKALNEPWPEEKQVDDMSEQHNLSTNKRVRTRWFTFNILDIHRRTRELCPRFTAMRHKIG